MKNKYVTLFLVSAVFLFFVVYFSTINLILNSEVQPGQTLTSVKEAVKSEQWEEADQKVQQLKTFWGTFQYLMMLNYATEDFTSFEEKLEDMDTAVQQKDKSEVLKAANQALYNWNNMMRLIPQP
ncbi:DUF4363 family protein [Paenibacillus turpanensis]|uniref:DUF4363 family protein n=1 Tax=Paenibacillus turpanensis TaxID=2689078 RepID=UPI00140DECD0|nr:DUF4363 family protein [Paenibacillus turpanensis]